MASRALSTVALVVLLLLAGCAGGAGGGGPAGGADEPATPTPSGPVFELPSSGAALADGHDAALQEAGSFTAETNVTTRDPSSGRVIAVAGTTAVDLDSGAVLARLEVNDNVEQTSYVDPSGDAYLRVTEGGRTTYQRPETPPDVSGLYRLPIEPLVDESTLAYVGREEVHGEAVAVYEVTDLEALVTPAGVGSAGSVDASRIESFDVRIGVSADGIVRLIDYQVAVDLDEGTWSMAMHLTFRDVGSTTVERPDWVDEVP